MKQRLSLFSLGSFHCSENEVYPFETIDEPFFLSFMSVCLLIPKLLCFYPSSVFNRFKPLELFRTVFVCVLALWFFPVAFFVIAAANFSQGFNYNAVESVAVFLWTSAAAETFCFIVFWGKNKVLERLNSELSQATKQRGLQHRKPCLKCFMVLTFVVTVLSLLIGTAANVSMLYGESSVPGKSAITNTLRLFPVPRPLLLVAMVYYTASWVSGPPLCLFVCTALVIEFQTLNRDLKAAGRLHLSQLLRFHETYEKLRAATRTADVMLRWFICTQLCSCIGIVIIAIYSLIVTRQLEPQHTYMLLFWFGCSAINLFIILIRCSTIAQLSAAPKDIIAEKVAGDEAFWNNAQLYSVANWIASRCEQPMGISFAGIVVITKGAILTVCSLIVTYITVLVQLDGGNGIQSESFDNSTLTNMTLV